MAGTHEGMGLPGMPDSAVNVCPQSDDLVWSWGISEPTQLSLDMRWYGNTASGASYMYFDASANTFTLTGVELVASGGQLFVDDAELALGTDDDAVFVWDGTNLILKTLADDKIFEIGDSATTQLSWDVKWYATAASGAEYLMFDAGESAVYTTGVDFWIKDNDVLAFGTGASKAGDVSIVWDETNLIFNAAVDDSIIEIGDSAATQLSFDVKIYGNAANGADYILMDAGASQLSLVGAYEQVLGRSIMATPTAKVEDYTVLAADSGKILTTEGATQNVNFTLPALAAGLHYWFYNSEDFTMTVTSPEGNNIIADNDLAATSVSFAQATELIGNGMYFVCDGSKWLSFLMLAFEDITVTIA